MRLTKKIDLAKKSGVSRAAITKATKENGALYHALSKNDMIDIDHDEVVRFLKKRGLTPDDIAGFGIKKEIPKTKHKKTPHKPKNHTTNERDCFDLSGVPPGYNDQGKTKEKEYIPNREINEDVETYLDMTLRQIIDRFGTEIQFRELLDARRKIEDIKAKEFSNKIKSNEYIPRDLVEKHIFPFIDNSFRRLVEDVPGTMARQIRSKVLSDSSDEEITIFIRDSISKTIKGVKDKSIKVLGK